MQFFSAHTGIIIKSISLWICAAVALIAITATAAYNFVFEQINGIRITRADFILRKDEIPFEENQTGKRIFINGVPDLAQISEETLNCLATVLFEEIKNNRNKNC